MLNNNSMKSLIFDTSHEIYYIILAKDKEIIFFKKLEKAWPSKPLASETDLVKAGLKTGFSKELFPTIDNLLKETNTDLSDLKYIATSIGPGSFTALRVGATICKTLCFAKKIPLISYISLEAYAPLKAYIPLEIFTSLIPRKFLSVFDAKSDGIYSLEGFFKENEIIYSSEPKLLSIQEAEKLFETISIIISPDAELLKEKFKNHKNKFNLGFFDPIRLVNITENLYENKKFSNYKSLNLLYLRGPNHICPNHICPNRI